MALLLHRIIIMSGIVMTVIMLTPEADNYVATTAGDVIQGLGGNDTLKAGAGGNRLDGGDGDDVLNGAAGNDTIIGDDQSNLTAHNVMNGLGGDDLIVSYSWYDQVTAGSGNDTVSSWAQQTSQVMDGGTGIDTLEINSLIDSNDPVHFVMGQTTTFSIAGINGATYVNFEALKVTLGTGSCSIEGGNYNDRILFAYNNNSNAVSTFEAGTIRANGGDDVIAFNGITASGGGVEQIYGGDGYDSLSWTIGTATIIDLSINAATGIVTADGHKFAHFFEMEAVSFYAYSAITGALDYKGFAGADSINVAATLSSTVSTFGGNDNISVNGGPATVLAGAGDDVITAGFYTETSAVSFSGGDGNDRIVGGSGLSHLFGDAGNDTIDASNTHSQVHGGSGDDILSLTFLYASTSGSGAGVLDGGSGHDRLTLTLAGLDALTFNCNGQSLTLPDGTRITGIEGFNLQAARGNDNLTSSNGSFGAIENILNGGAGNDTLHALGNGAALDGSFGADRLIGGAGNDLLNGGYGLEGDTLLGGAGNDTLTGAYGRDSETGGLGADWFVLNAYYETGITPTTRDRITDFKSAEGDKIDLTAVDANTTALATGDQAFDYISHALFHHVAGELRSYSLNRAGTAHDVTIVVGDINGDGVGDFTVELAGLVNLHDADFSL